MHGAFNTFEGGWGESFRHSFAMLRKRKNIEATNLGGKEVSLGLNKIFLETLFLS